MPHMRHRQTNGGAGRADQPADEAARNPGDPNARSSVARSASEDARLLARGELPVGRADLSAGQSAARIAAHARAHQAASAGPLGHDAGIELSLRPPEPADQGERSEHDLRHRSRPWRPGDGGADLSRRLVHRALSGDRAQPATGCSGCSASSPGRTEFPATSRRKRRARSTKAANWAIRWPMPMARRSTIPI